MLLQDRMARHQPLSGPPLPGSPENRYFAPQVWGSSGESRLRTLGSRSRDEMDTRILEMRRTHYSESMR